jgi:glycosyltransferase involved in cell wall biosynthesis
VNDGGASISEDFLKQFSIRIEHYQKEHSGVSATRNFALKKATAEYVMFCDADD